MWFLVILVNGCLKGFDVSYILTGGGPGNATELVATYMYKTAFSMSNFGYGSTLAVFILIESLIAVGIVKLIRKNSVIDGGIRWKRYRQVRKQK